MAADVVGDSDIEAPPSIVGDDDGAAPRPRALRALQVDGPMRLYLLLACEAATFGAIAAWPLSWPAVSACEFLLIAVVLAPAWHFAAIDSEPTSDAHAQMRRSISHRSRAKSVLGFVEISVHAVARLVTPVVVQSPVEALTYANNMVNDEVEVFRHGQNGAPEARSLGDILKDWRAGRPRPRPMVCAEVAGGIAHLVTLGMLAVLHTLHITPRLSRERLFVYCEPPKAQVRIFVRNVIANQHDVRASMSAAAYRKPAWSRFMTDPELLLEWVEVTAFAKSIRQIPAASFAWARPFARASNIDRGRLAGNLQHTSYRSLCAARVRLDCVAMLLFRQYIADLMDEYPATLHIYVFCDASPQPHGEFFAATIDIFVGTTFLRRSLLPCLMLDPALMDALGKTISLLWLFWLVAGPHFAVMRKFLACIRSITTDMGVERMIPDSVDCLEEFFKLVAPRFRIGLHPEESKLFRHALQIPGWKHALDNILQKSLSSLSWFPLWLSRFKSIISFVRIDGHRRLMIRQLRSAGASGVAALLTSASFPSFAEWRWGTLHSCMVEMHKFLDSLIAHFDPAPFHRSRDATGLQSMCAAFACPTWRLQTDFVAYMCQWLVSLQQWCSGCSCHEEQLRAGQSVECVYKGRRLTAASVVVHRELDMRLAEGEAWSEHEWGLGFAGLIELQGCMRGTIHLARRKFLWLDKIPYLFARLDQPGVAAQCCQQWTEVTAEQHHRVSSLFLMPGGQLRAEIDRLEHDASNISPLLQAAIDGLKGIPFDDGVAEGPHARALRLHRTYSRSLWPWVASTMRLSQNLVDVRALVSGLDLDLHALWCGYSSVLRVGRSRPLQPIRMSKKKVQEYIYRIAFATEDVPGVEMIDRCQRCYTNKLNDQ